MAPETMLPDATRMGAVHLRVRDPGRMSSFYSNALGLRVLSGDDGVALGVDEPLVVLHPSPDALPRVRGAAGLFHVAVLLPTRADLARLLHHLVASRTPLHGASDHAVSEAIYLADPEGNGIELYADRPRDAWPRDGDGGGGVAGGVGMTTQPLDIEDLLAQAADAAATTATWSGVPAGTRVGHVHLQVDDVPAAEKFYRDVVGFEITARYGDQASFYAAGGYHHHVATNAWGVAPGARADPTRLGLRRFTLRVGDAAALDALEARLRAADAPVARAQGERRLLTRDPAGNELTATA